MRGEKEKFAHEHRVAMGDRLSQVIVAAAVTFLLLVAVARYVL